MGNAIIILAGATGDLGRRIAKALRERGAKVRALVRRSSVLDYAISFLSLFLLV